MSASPLVPLYGSIYFASILSTAFYGVMCMQTFFYYIHYQNDPLRIKIFVAAVCAFNTIQEALTISGAYKSIMEGLVNPYSLSNGLPELVLQLLFTALVAVATQGFFIYRIYIFNGKNIVVPLISAPLVIYPLVATFIYVGKALYSSNGVHAVGVFEFSDHFFMGISTSSFSVAAAVDVLIAIFLTCLLVRKRTTAEFSSTAYMLQRLTVFAVNAGIWTATFALLSLILLHVYPSNLLYAVFTFPLCSVYSNTLLANLNARAYIRGETTTANVDTNLFASSTSRVSCGTKGDKRSKVVSFRTSVNEGHEGMMVLPMVIHSPTTATSESACA